MGLELRYTIPFLPESLNRFAGRKNCWEYRAEKQRWKDLAAVYCRPRPKTPVVRAVVTLQYFFPTRVRHDPDNYCGKAILDGLTGCGILQDDSFDHIRLSLEGGYDKQRPRTEITITGMEEA